MISRDSQGFGSVVYETFGHLLQRKGSHGSHGPDGIDMYRCMLWAYHSGITFTTYI